MAAVRPSWHVGIGTPTGGIGAYGDFYIDTAGDDIYGPKSATGFSQQRIAIPMAPNGVISVADEAGVRVRFARGRVTKSATSGTPPLPTR